MSDFLIEIYVDGAWRKVRRFKATSGEVRVYQRAAGGLTPAAHVLLYSGDDALTTTVTMDGLTRFKKRTVR